MDTRNLLLLALVGAGAYYYAQKRKAEGKPFLPEGMNFLPSGLDAQPGTLETQAEAVEAMPVADTTLAPAAPGAPSGASSSASPEPLMLSANDIPSDFWYMN